MPSDKMNESTRREWRELGFYYELNNETKEWVIQGSRAGLVKFAQILLDYSNNPKRQGLSEHHHLGPYWYLEIGTWNSPLISDHSIAGSLQDLKHLSEMISERVSKAMISDTFFFRETYAPDSPYELMLEVREDEFDPAVADSHCW